MLVLTRRIQESIIIGNDIHVKVIGMCDGSVRLGIEAPQKYSVHRKEIYDRILAQAEGRESVAKNMAAGGGKVIRTIDSPIDGEVG